MTLIEKLIKKIEIITNDMDNDRIINDFEQQNHIKFVEATKATIELLISTQPTEYKRVLELEDIYNTLPNDTKELYDLVIADVNYSPPTLTLRGGSFVLNYNVVRTGIPRKPLKDKAINLHHYFFTFTLSSHCSITHVSTRDTPYLIHYLI